MEIDSLMARERMLQFRAARNEVLAANIAHADTPGYKARDIDFEAALNTAIGGSMHVSTTSDLHMQASNYDSLTATEALKYRIPMQSSLDGNTVETDVEQAAFAENSLMYRASLEFLNSQIRTIKYAIKGGD